MSEESMTGARAIIEFAERRTVPEVSEFNTYNGATIPFFINGRGEAQSLLALEDERADAPRRRKGTIGVSEVASFIELVNRNKLPHSVIFASKDRVCAVLNFHGTKDPGFCDDQVVYRFPLSEEWSAWRSRDGSKFDQKAFAEFVENRAFDVGVPSDAGAITEGWAKTLSLRLAGPGELQTLAEGLSVRVEETVENTFRSASGESTMVHKSEHKDIAGQPLKVPGAFHVRIPIVEGGPVYSIPVRLRYRVGGGKVSWFYEMHRPDIFLKHALDDTIKAVKEGCGLPVYMGQF